MPEGNEHSMGTANGGSNELLILGLVNQLESSIYVVQDYRVVFANPSFSKLTGYSDSELKEILFLDIVHPKDRKLIKLLFEDDFAEFRKHSSNSFTFRILTHYNEQKWIKTIFSIIDWEGKSALLYSSYDITQQKETEEALASQEQNLSMLVNAFGDLVFIVNHNYNVVQTNHAALAALGYQEHELMLESFVRLHAESERSKAITALMEVFEGEPKLYVTEFVKKNGKPIPLEVRMIKGLWRRRDVIFIIARDITERLAAEHSIRVSEEKFSRAFNAGAVMMSISTLNGGVFVDVNRAFVEKIGLSREQVIGRSSKELNIFRQIERREELITEVKRRGRVENIEVEIENISGNVYTALLSAEIINLQGEDCLLLAMSDITYRKQMEEELAKSRAQLRGALDNLPFIAWLKDTRRGYLIVNKGFISYFNLSEQEVLGKSYADTWNEPILALLQEKERQVVKSKKAASWEIREGERGTEEWWEFSLTPVLSRFNRVIAITGIARRITEYKINQIKIQKNLERQILLTEFSYLFNTSLPFDEQLDKVLNLVVSRIGLSKVFTVIGVEGSNRVSIFGSKAALIKLKLEEFYNGNKLAISQHYELQAGNKFDITGSSVPGFTELKRVVDGQYLFVLPLMVKSQCFGIFGVDYLPGEKVKAADDREFLLTLSNILSAALESHLNEVHLRTAKELAEQASRAKERFLSTMSHEIRTPMNAIIGMTNLLIEENPKPEQLGNLNSLRFAAENLLSLLNDILDFSKIEAGKLELIKADIDVRNLIIGVHATFEQLARSKNLELVSAVKQDVPNHVVGDRVRLNQILTNLIGNAIKFTERGEVAITVDINKLQNDLIWLLFTVKDSGIGIPADKLNDIFGEFTQLHARASQAAGTGLGLAIVKRLVELMGGEIWVESELGKGSCFYFTVPFEIAVGRASVDKIDVDAQIPPGMFRVLIVEDNELNTLVLKRFLDNWGISYEHAENGRIALDFVKNQNFDAVLMDLEMPEMNGYEAATAIRNLPNRQKAAIPIIALSASALLDVQSKIFGIGMNDFVLKPFKPQILKSKLAKYLSKND